MLTRREMMASTLLLGGAAAVSGRAQAQISGETDENPAPVGARRTYNPTVTLNGSTLPWKMKDGVKEFHLTAEPVEREFAPGMTVKCWGYNGQTPGPTIEAVEGDRIRLLVTNNLPEHTTIHWHGIFLPSPSLMNLLL